MVPDAMRATGVAASSGWGPQAVEVRAGWQAAARTNAAPAMRLRVRMGLPKVCRSGRTLRQIPPGGQPAGRVEPPHDNRAPMELDRTRHPAFQETRNAWQSTR